MKKTLLTAIFALLYTSVLFAQSSFAPEAGLNLANFRAKSSMPVSKTLIKPGVLIGANFPVTISPQFVWQPGAFFKMNGTVTESDHKTWLTVNSFEVPLDFWYRFGPPGTTVFAIGAGPYLNVNLAATASWNSYTDANGLAIPAGLQTLKIGASGNNDLKRFDAGLGLNAAVILRMGLFFRARYQFGFFDINAYPINDLQLKMNAISISVGYYVKNKAKKNVAAPVKATKAKKPRKPFSPLQDE